jgi:hypothetical protein
VIVGIIMMTTMAGNARVKMSKNQFRCGGCGVDQEGQDSYICGPCMYAFVLRKGQYNELLNACRKIMESRDAHNERCNYAKNNYGHCDCGTMRPIRKALEFIDRKEKENG